VIQWVVERLIGLLGAISRLRAKDRELADKALSTVSHALNETCLYYRDVASGSVTDKERESLLVRAWAAAAIPLRHIDTELADICQHKSEYWLNPESWDQDRIKQLGIGLDEVREQYRAKLRNV